MKFFSKEKTINYFSPYIEANFTVNLEETIMVETHDCYGGQINSESILRSDIDLGIMNQATGPIYVNNLTKNDVLKVTISDINLDDNGIMITSPGLGILGEEIKTPTTRILKVRDNKIHFDKKISIPVKPMIGVIGVATKKIGFIQQYPIVMAEIWTQRILPLVAQFTFQFFKKAGCSL